MNFLSLDVKPSNKITSKLINKDNKQLSIKSISETTINIWPIYCDATKTTPPTTVQGKSTFFTKSR